MLGAFQHPMCFWEKPYIIFFHSWSTTTADDSREHTVVLTGVSLGEDDKNQLFLPANDGTMKPMTIKFDAVELPIPK